MTSEASFCTNYAYQLLFWYIRSFSTCHAFQVYNPCSKILQKNMTFFSVLFLFLSRNFTTTHPSWAAIRQWFIHHLSGNQQHRHENEFIFLFLATVMMICCWHHLTLNSTSPFHIRCFSKSSRSLTVYETKSAWIFSHEWMILNISSVRIQRAISVTFVEVYE